MPLTRVTKYPPQESVVHTWWQVNADDQILGRLATTVAMTLMGKTRPDYSPHVNPNVHVIVTNATKIKLTGRKAEYKTYFTHSGYMGGDKHIPYARMMAEKPEEIIRLAIRRMLPKNNLGRHILLNLKVYVGDAHPHEAQQPQPLPLPVKKSK